MCWVFLTFMRFLVKEYRTNLRKLCTVIYLLLGVIMRLLHTTYCRAQSVLEFKVQGLCLKQHCIES